MDHLNENRDRHHGGVLALENNVTDNNFTGNDLTNPDNAADRGQADRDLRSVVDATLDRFATCVRALDDTTSADGATSASTTTAASRYRVLRPHAKGGLGRVSVAVEEGLNRQVALKELLNHHADNPASRSRFVLEAEVTGNLEHPGIVPVYGLGKFTDGRPYYAMRFIRGGSLSDALKKFHVTQRNSRSDSLEFRKLLRRFIDVCNAVEYAHSRGVLHRDLKPDNVMLGEYGETLVVDWGLAKVIGQPEQPAELRGCGSSDVLPISASDSSKTVAGYAIGTPQYMSPEQAAGQLDRLSPASDVYSLGAMLYCLLTGGPPIRNLSVHDTLRCVHTGNFPRPRERTKHVSPALEAVCLKAMALKPEQRYASARALVDDLEHWLADEPVAAYHEPISRRLARFARRHRVWTQATATALLVIAVVSALATYVTHQQRRVAERLADENASLATAETTLRKTAERQAAFLAFERSYADCLRADAAQGMNALALGLREATRVDAADAETSIRLQLAGWTRCIQPLRWVLQPVDGHVTCVAFSPDARQIATGDDAGTAQLWSLETGHAVGQPFRHTRPVSAVAFDATGKILLMASLDKTVCVRDLATGAELCAPLVHPEPVTCAALSPDGKTIVTGSTDSNGRLWDARTGKQIGPLLAHDGSVSSVAFSPDGKRIVTGSHDKSARLWDAATGLPAGPVILHADQVNAVAFDPQGELIVTGSGNAAQRSGIAQYWDSETGRAVGSPLVHQDTVDTLSPSPDGKALLTGSNDHMARLWDLTDRRPIGAPLMHNGRVSGVTFSRDGSRMLTGSGAGPARVWQVTNSCGGSSALEHAGSVRSTSFSPDGKFVLTASEDGRTRLWNRADLNNDGASPKSIREWPGTVAAISADGKSIVTGDKDQTARCWDLATGQSIGSALRHSAAIAKVEFSRDGRYLLTRTEDCTAYLWHIDNVANPASQLVRRWVCHAAAFSPDGTSILSGCDDGRAHLQETVSGRAVGVPFVQHKAVIAVAFHPNGNFLLTGSSDSTARLWNIETGKLAGRPMFHRHCVSAVAFSPDGKTIITGSEDNTARLWETHSLLQIGPPLKHQGSVRSVAFSPDGHTAVTGSVDGLAQFWDSPAPLAGEVERIILWTQVVTGLSLEQDGVLDILTEESWTARKKQFAEMPGPRLP